MSLELTDRALNISINNFIPGSILHLIAYSLWVLVSYVVWMFLVLGLVILLTLSLPANDTPSGVSELWKDCWRSLFKPGSTETDSTETASKETDSSKTGSIADNIIKYFYIAYFLTLYAIIFWLPTKPMWVLLGLTTAAVYAATVLYFVFKMVQIGLRIRIRYWRALRKRRAQMEASAREKMVAERNTFEPYCDLEAQTKNPTTYRPVSLIDEPIEAARGVWNKGVLRVV